MTSQQKFDHAMSMKPFASRKDIPVFPHTCTYAAVPAGVTQKDIFKGNDAWMDAYKKCCEVTGYPDVAFPIGPKTVTYIEQMPVRIPGKDLGDKIGAVFADGCDIAILENHGVCIGAKDMFTAFQRFEIIQHGQCRQMQHYQLLLQYSELQRLLFQVN